MHAHGAPWPWLPQITAYVTFVYLLVIVRYGVFQYGELPAVKGSSWHRPYHGDTDARRNTVQTIPNDNQRIYNLKEPTIRNKEVNDTASFTHSCWTRERERERGYSMRIFVANRDTISPRGSLCAESSCSSIAARKSSRQPL